MACQKCGEPANGDLCAECRRMEHQEEHYGTPSDYASESSLSISDEYESAMPDLENGEYYALKESIRKHGVEYPILVDREGNIVDGHHRFRAWHELGKDGDPPTIVVDTEDDIERALRPNLARRDFSSGQKREAVKRYLENHWDGERTQREVAGDLGVSQRTVSNAEQELKEAGKLSNLSKFSKSQKRQQVADYLDANPDASNREVADAIDADVSHATVGNWRENIESGTDKTENGDGDLKAYATDSSEVEAASEVFSKKETDETAEQKAREVAEGELSPTEAKQKVDQAERERQEQKETEEKREERLASFNDASDTIQLVESPFQDVGIEAESIDHIVTDPPYGDDSIELWSDLSKFADQVLKPGGFCIAYSGKYHLPEVMTRMSEELEYYWQSVVVHQGPGAKFFARRLRTGYKPVLVYAKPPIEKQEDFISDVIKGGGREKDNHDWQQAEYEAGEILNRFTAINDRICDPMAGSGTTAVACQRLDRRCVAIDRDADAVASMRRRLDE